MHIYYNQANQNQQLMPNHPLPETSGEVAASQSTDMGGSSIYQLQPGQVFSGEITDIRHSYVTILLDNNQMMAASIMEQIEMSIGSKMLFQVQENNGSRISIKPYQGDVVNSGTHTAMKALDANHLPVNDRNIAAVQEMMKHQMPLDKQSIQKIAGFIQSMPEASVEDLVIMYKNSIPITKSNVEQFAAYRNAEHQLTAKVEDISDGISKALQQMGEKGSVTQLLQLNGQLVDVLTNAAMAGESAGQGENQTDGITNTGVVTDSKEALANANSKVVSELLTPQDLDELLMNLKQLEDKSDVKFYHQLKEKLVSGEMKVEEFLKEMKNVIEQVKQEETVYPELKKILLSDPYRLLLKSENESASLLNPDDLNDSKSLNDFYEKLTQKAEKLHEIFKNTGEAGEKASANAQNVKENVDFMKAMNQMYQYTQLPMMLKNQNAHGDLYVFTNKRELRKNKEEISVLLHLDMDHLGELDIYVQMKGKNISAKFYMDDEDSMRIIDDNMETLKEKIADDGFSLNTEVNKRNRQVDFVRDFIGEEAKETEMSRYSFDVRA